MKIEFFDAISGISDLPEYHPGRAEIGKIELFDVVALTHDIPESNLRRGEVGTVVHIFPNDEAFEVEFSDRNGQTYQCLSFLSSQLIVLHHEPMQTQVDSTPTQLIAD